MKFLFLLQFVIILALTLFPIIEARAETFLSIDQAKQAIWQDTKLEKIDIFLTKPQMKSISKASKTRVRNPKIQAWKTPDNGWFIVDQVVGKHEFIDFAIGLDSEGKVRDVEILTYRETYGGQVRNPKWLAQFFGKDHKEHLKLRDQIQNISGATLSCKHMTDGVNRINHTWNQVLKYL